MPSALDCKTTVRAASVSHTQRGTADNKRNCVCIDLHVTSGNRVHVSNIFFEAVPRDAGMPDTRDIISATSRSQ
jgi:hypothetical protein